MCRILSLLLLLLSGFAAAQDASEQSESEPREPAQGEARQEPDQSQPAAEKPGAVKTLSGMSILGNEEAPKALVIVPWKSSQIGDELGVTNAMDERARPVDKEVFMREVHYYELRSGGTDD